MLFTQSKTSSIRKILIWCFVCFTLFNLQDTDRCAALVDSLFIIAACRSLVNPFFRIFLNSFGAQLAAACPCGQPVYTTTLFFPCQPLFSGFFSFFGLTLSKQNPPALTDGFPAAGLNPALSLLPWGSPLPKPAPPRKGLPSGSRSTHG